MYDIIIVGGGPSGSTLARLIGKDYKVLLLEKREFGDEKNLVTEKCCGGLIAPDAQLMLAKFGLGIPKTVLLSPQLFSVRTLDIDNSIERYYQRHYINIDRHEFDKWLESIIPSSVDIINGCIYQSYSIDENHITVKYNKDGKVCEEKAKLLVGADGAYSKVRRQSFPKTTYPELYISIQEWFETTQNSDYYGAIFDSSVTDFYSWTIPKENQLIFGSALKPGKDAISRFNALKEKMGDYGFDFSSSLRRNGAYLFRPTAKEQICIGGSRIALTGEAAGFISPSSAEGLSYALKSSLELAKALNGGIEGYHKTYENNIKALVNNVLFKNMKSPAMYNKLLRRVILKSGIMSIELENP